MARHMFAGGNTPNGFLSFFEYILPLSAAKKIIYLKGGSGTGKSTFMKKVGRLFEERENQVEYMHCSNDAESLDGVLIADLNISLIDATMPHIQDPAAPMAIDMILNFADYLNENDLHRHCDEICQILTEKKIFFEKAYRYFAAAAEVYKNNVCIYSGSLDRVKLNTLFFELCGEVFKGEKKVFGVGKNRKMFASAVTPNGLITNLDSLMTRENRYFLYGNAGCGMDVILTRIQHEANAYGFDTESFYCPICPKKLEHLIIPKLDICFTTVNEYHSCKLPPIKEINFYSLCNDIQLENAKNEIEYNQNMFEQLLQKSMNIMNDSKLLHNRLEDIYVNCMDFKALELQYDKTIRDLLSINA